MPDIAHPAEDRRWRDTARLFIHPRVISMLFLGFSAGVPILLIFSSLGLWLREAGVDLATVTFFSWAALGYSFKFVWAPLVDQLPLPMLGRLGRRRGWMLLSQLMVIGAIVAMALTDPATSDTSLTLMALAAVLLGFSSATQDVVIDAYRIESAPTDLQALMSSAYIAGYRIGMLAAGAGALYLASELGSEKGQYLYEAWRWTYLCMAGLMLVGVATTLLITEPTRADTQTPALPAHDYARFLGVFVLCVSVLVAGYALSGPLVEAAKGSLGSQLNNAALGAFLVETIRLPLLLGVAASVGAAAIRAGLVNRRLVVTAYIAPMQDFFTRYGLKVACLLLGLIALYRVSDIVLGVIANVFFQDLGFSKAEIATIVKTFGLLMTIVGGFLGGILCMRVGVMRVLLLGAMLSAATNLLFLWLATVGHNVPLLYLIISADNLSAGLASAAFVAFLSSLTNVSFTAVQYALFSSLMTLLPKVLGGYSGSMVDSLGYPLFFLVTTLLGIPVLVLILFASRHLKTASP